MRKRTDALAPLSDVWILGTPSPDLPKRLGRYVILYKIGEGGMGVVYAARDEQLGRTVAVKILSGISDETARKRFWREARVTGGPQVFNRALERAGRIADFLEFGETMCWDALTRDESCGVHFREEHQTPDGEALR